jgi:hypothetical protein
MKFPSETCIKYTAALLASEIVTMEDLKLFYEVDKDFKWSSYGIVADFHIKQMDAFLKYGEQRRSYYLSSVREFDFEIFYSQVFLHLLLCHL